MICVLTLFGEMDFRSALMKCLHNNDIFFIEDNCNTSVQLTTQVEARRKEVDAVIIYSNAVNMDLIQEYVEELRGYVENLRVVLILVGDPNTFLRSQINQYRDINIDIVFDNDGFDADDLVKILQKGKLSNKEHRTHKKKSEFTEDVDNTSILERVKGISKPDVYENMGHFTIGIMNAARGAGSTWTANHLARFFSMQNFKTCILDKSMTEAVSMMKLKNIDIFDDGSDIEELKDNYNVTIIDFGTPIEISPNGENFKLMSQYKPETIRCFTECDIKLIMGFADPWNIEKINFFFINEIWRNQFDDSCLFIIADKPERVKKLFPEGNVFSRKDDYREHILTAFRKDEFK